MSFQGYVQFQVSSWCSNWLRGLKSNVSQCSRTLSWSRWSPGVVRGGRGGCHRAPWRCCWSRGGCEGQFKGCNNHHHHLHHQHHNHHHQLDYHDHHMIGALGDVRWALCAKVSRSKLLSLSTVGPYSEVKSSYIVTPSNGFPFKAVCHPIGAWRPSSWRGRASSSWRRGTTAACLQSKAPLW